MATLNSLLLALFASLLTPVAGQDGALRLCTGDGCDYCPNSLTQQGTGYPACVIYEKETVLGGYIDQYEGSGDVKTVYFDVPEVSNPDCQTIIRSPADTTIEDCGYPVFAGKGGQCAMVDVTRTVMIQFCCGLTDCGKAGVRRRFGGSGQTTSLVLRDDEGNLVVPHAVAENGKDLMAEFLYDHGINQSTSLESYSASGMTVYRLQPADGTNSASTVQKRDCDTYIPDGGEYTRLGTESFQISAYICGSTTEFTYTNEMSISRTTTFSASVGDPFGIASVSVGFESTEETSQSYQYTFKPEATQCGHISWTPKFRCSKGQITGCTDGPQTGEVCTAAVINDKQIDGAYGFVQTG